MSEFIHLVDNGVYKLDHVDDIGTQWMKCSVCGETKNLNELERNRQEALAKLKLEQEKEKEILKEWNLEDLTKVLDLTIKGDSPNKEIIFLVSLLTYTDNHQQNIIIGGPTCVGKTYITEEILKLFPKEDIQDCAGASPKSFIHRPDAQLIDSHSLPNIIPISAIPKPEKGAAIEEINEYRRRLSRASYYLDLKRKIVFFTDMPDTKLLENLRSLLSHDNQNGIATYYITETTKKGIRTKTVIIHGFFTSIFTTASTYLDTQDASRHFILTPDDNPDKFSQAITLETEMANNEALFWMNIENNPERKFLKERILRVKDFKCQRIEIPKEVGSKLEQWFKSKYAVLHPKASRDYKRVEALVRAWALFNFHNRQKEADNEKVIIANEKDLETAIRLYEPILESQQLGLSPECYKIFKMIEPQLPFGLLIKDIHLIYYQNKKMPISDKRLRGLLENLRNAGLIREEKEGRSNKYYPVKEEGEVQTRIEGELPNANS